MPIVQFILSEQDTFNKEISIMEQQVLIKIFFCYAKEDVKIRDELEKHLSALKKRLNIQTWHDREIQPGANWQNEIDHQLCSSDLILLLISPHFFNSDYCYGTEMQKALELHREHKVCIVPVILSPVEWQITPISDLQVLPTKGKPVTSWKNKKEAYHDIEKGIHIVIKEIIYSKLIIQGERLYNVNYYSDALDCFEQALTYHKDNAGIILKKAHTLMRLRSYPQAIKCYDLVLSQFPNDASTHLSKAYALLSFGEYNKALKACEAAIQLEPNNPDFLAKKVTFFAAWENSERRLSFTQKIMM